MLGQYGGSIPSALYASAAGRGDGTSNPVLESSILSRGAMKELLKSYVRKYLLSHGWSRQEYNEFRNDASAVEWGKNSRLFIDFKWNGGYWIAWFPNDKYFGHITWKKPGGPGHFPARRYLWNN